MIYFYSNRPIYADIFIRAFQEMTGLSVEHLLGADIEKSGVPEIFIVDSVGLHLRVITRISSVYTACPVVVISDKPNLPIDCAALIPDGESVGGIIRVCQILLGRVSDGRPASLFSLEEEVLFKPLMRGDSNKEMARDLGIPVSVVKYHLEGLYKKIGVRNRAQAAIKISETIL